MFLKVLTSSRSYGISSGLTYESPIEGIMPGTPVRVPLRKDLVEGIVLEVLQDRAKDAYDLKQVQEILGEEPLLTEPQLKTLQWMADYYHCTPRQALVAWLPTPPWSALLPTEITEYRLMKDQDVRGSKQKMVMEYLQGKEWVNEKELREETAVSPQIIRSLIEKGLIESQTVKEKEVTPLSQDVFLKTPQLTDVQQDVYSRIKNEKKTLLFGITSSGKTEIYAQLIADTINEGKSAILLVPEILLTEHCIPRFEELLDRQHIAVLHSRLTPAQRRNEWKRIHRGEARLVIGSRSALFAPCKHLGLVILDEEHEWTYKSEQTPRYHARETAEKLCEFAGAKLLLGTATPSLESWARTQSGRYHLERLPERYGKHPLPTVRVIDLADIKFGNLYPFSPPLLEAIEDRLNKGEQSVLFLNRRGIATSLLCLGCRRRIVSPDSQMPFTVHRSPQGRVYLQDHTSGTIADVPKECPACQSTDLKSVGAGTQRVEELLSARFPGARLLRADADTLTHPDQMRLLLKKMREGEADILLGTQSVVKGLDLPNVTLAAVILADVGLSLPHFRAGERIFQLLTQLTGRSGRAKPGEVIVQTYRPDAAEIKLAAEHKTEEYILQEMKMRVFAGYPPIKQMVRLIVRGDEAPARAKRIAEEIKKGQEGQKSEEGIVVSVSPTFFGAGKVWHVLIRGDDARKVLKDLNLEGAVVDIDPMECV